MKKVFMLTAVVLVSLSGANAFAYQTYNYPPRNLQRVEQRLETVQQNLEQRLTNVTQRLDNVQQRIETRQTNRCRYSRYC